MPPENEANQNAGQEGGDSGAEKKAAEMRAKNKQDSQSVDGAAVLKQVTDAVAAQLKGFRGEIDGEIKKLVKGKVKEDVEEEDFDAQFYADPKGTLARVIKQAVDEAKSELTAQYQQERSYNDFWNGFYSENGHLKEHDGIVRAVLASKEAGWAKEGITVGESYKRLAEATSAIGKKLTAGEKSDGEAPSMTIDGMAFIQAPKREEGGEKVGTLSDAIKARQKKFMKG